jgi:uncharacterized protein YbaP (TraB family)
MKKHILMLVALCFCASAAAQSSVWKVSRGDSVLYLGGSVHVLRANDFPLPKEFDTAFANSGLLVLETNLDEMTDPVALQRMVARVTLPAGKTLKTELSPHTYEQLATKCVELGLSVDSFSSFTPVMAVMTLTTLQLQKLGFMAQGVDLHYLARARQEDKKLAFLESVEDQMSLLDGEDFLLQFLDDLDTQKLQERMPVIIAEWKKGQTAQTEKMIAQMKKEAPDFYRRVFFERNQAWLGKIERYLENRETEFILVGLGHLTGEEGLLQRLREKGDQVEQVR